jgi:uncharacterized protein (TIGR02001 family)
MARGGNPNTDLAVAAAVLALVTIAGAPAFGQNSADTSGRAINLGSRGWSAPEGAPQQETSQFELSARAGFATDYMYRGTTLSDRKPAVGAAFEATFSRFYAGVSVASVKLPTQPAAEVAISAGVREKIADINFDLGATYFAYPKEIMSPGIDYWEALIRADKNITESIRVAGGFAYSPNVSNTGAWSWYAAAGIGYDLPAAVVPKDIGVAFTAAAGYSWFGNQSAELGGFPLPAYLNWHAGVTFSYKVFNLDLRYYDTNLSQENCFVLTGDPNALPGGVINPITNPDGLRSHWCGTTFVAKAWFALN